LSTAVVILLPPALIMHFLGFSLDGVARTIIGIIFLFSAILSLLEILARLGRIFGNPLAVTIKKRAYSKGIIKNLYALTPKERMYLVPFINENSISMNMPIYDGIVKSLESLGIIQRVSSVSTPGAFMGFDYLLNRLVWDELHRNPMLIGMEQKQAKKDAKKRQMI